MRSVCAVELKSEKVADAVAAQTLKTLKRDVSMRGLGMRDDRRSPTVSGFTKDGIPSGDSSDLVG